MRMDLIGHVTGQLFLAILAATPVIASDWWITEVNGVPALEGAGLSFSPDGGVAGSTGCNRFNTPASQEGLTLIFSKPVAITRMACPGEDLTRQDDTIARFFEGRIDIIFDPFTSGLTLTKDNRSSELRLVAANTGPEVPKPHAGRERPAGDPKYLSAFGIEGELQIRADASETSDIIGAVLPGTVLRNEGCTEAAGNRWCSVSLPDGSLTGFAAAAKLEETGPDLRAGQGIFDATGLLPCAKGAGAPTTQCPFGVARGAPGTATVRVWRPDGIDRFLMFVDGAFAFADVSEAGGGFETAARKEVDLNFVRVDNERYEIPDAVVNGG